MKCSSLVMVLIFASILSCSGDSPVAVTKVVTIRLEANIDGRSQLIIRENTAQWHHFDWAAPGRHVGANDPTVINGVEWFPVWPDNPDAENRFCDCLSNVFDEVSPPLQRANTSVTITMIQARDSIKIVQSPSSSNQFTLIVEFDDDISGGSDTYIVELVSSVN